MLHKLWSWCTVEPRLLIEVLRILSTLTAQFPKGAYSVKPMSLVAVYFALTFLQYWRVKKQQTAYLTTWLFFPALFLWRFTVWRWGLPRSWKTREKINFATIVLVYFNYRVRFFVVFLMLTSLFKWIRVLSINLAIIRRSSCRRRRGILNSLLFLSQRQHISLAAQACQEASAAPYKAGAHFYTVLSSWPIKQTASFKISRARNWTVILLCLGPCLICWVTWP